MSQVNEITIFLPYRLIRETICDLLKNVIGKIEKYKILIFDFSKLNWIDPTGVTVLSNLFEFLHRCNLRVEIIGYEFNPINTKAINYLDDSGLFYHYLKRRLIDTASIRPTTLRLERVEFSKSYQYMEGRLLPWLAFNLNVNKSSLSTMKVCFQEIFNNIKDHSQVILGCIFAQHYPQKKQIIIAISDFGVGIPFNVNKVNPGFSDHAAIEKACEEGYTTQTTGKNRGAGLDVLIKNTVQNNRGTLIIQSCQGIVSCFKEDNSVKINSKREDGFYPGTLIELILNTDHFVGDDPDSADEVFEW